MASAPDSPASPASAPSAASAAAPISGPRLRYLWQVPAFLVGVTALVAVLTLRPFLLPPGAGREVRARAALREAVSSSVLDRDTALALAGELLRPTGGAARDGETAFLVGSLHLRLAEQAGANGPAGLEHALHADHFLEQAELLGVPDDDRDRLAYRRGKSLARRSGAAARVVELLDGRIDSCADSPADAARAYGMLAAALLSLPEPDLARALAANTRQIDLPIVDEEVLAPARLLRADLLLRLGRPEEARAALRNIGDKAPAGVTAQARRLLVRGLQSEGHWAEAAEVWQQIRDDRRSPPPDLAAVLYHLGFCHQQAGRRADALRSWQECLQRDAPGDEAPAAALGLAALYQLDGLWADTALVLERAVRNVAGPAEWHNALVPLDAAREAFETACRRSRDAGAAETSLRLAALYERLAPPGRAALLRGQAADAAARARREQAAGPERSADDRRRLAAEADALALAAAEAYELAAGKADSPADRGERLWLAALRYREGQDPRRAAAASDAFLKLAQQPEILHEGRFVARLGEAWYRLAGDRRALQDENAALAAFRECLKWPGPFAYRARYQLALAEKARGRPDDAQAALEHNLHLLRDARDDRDAEALEKTLFALGDLYFERRELKGELAKAISCLESALEQFPTCPEATFARYELAESYRLLADQLTGGLGPQERLSVEARLRIEQEAARHRQRAAASYQDLAAALLARTVRNQTEDALLVYASFSTADCRFMLGDYEGAGRLYEALAERYKGRVEYYNALAGVVRSYSVPGSRSPEKARQALAHIRAGLDQLDPATRQDFQKWLAAFESGAAGGRSIPDAAGTTAARQP